MLFIVILIPAGHTYSNGSQYYQVHGWPGTGVRGRA
jgi:hypothetical protein